jgi:hypothetical protein
VEDIYRAAEKIHASREVADSLVKKLLADQLKALTPEEKLLLAATFYIKNPYAYRFDIAKRASTVRNPLRYSYGDIPGVDTPDALPLLEKIAAMLHTPLTKYMPKPAKRELQKVAPRTVPAPKRKTIGAEELRLADYLWENIPKRYRSKWRYIQVLNLARFIVKTAREHGMDPWAVDWAHELDWSLTYSELKNAIAQRLGAYAGPGEREIEEYMRYMEMIERTPVEMEFAPHEVEQMLREMEYVYV